MKVVIDIIKRFAFELICGVLAAGGIAAIIIGLGDPWDTLSKMQEASRVQSSLSSMGNPINQQAVDLAQERIDKIKSSERKVIQFASKLNAFEPLVDNVFGKDWVPPSNKNEFQKAYQAEIKSWLKLLKAGSVPTEDAIRQEQDRIDAEQPVDESLGTGRDQIPEESKVEKATENLPRKNADIRAAIRNANMIYCYAEPSSFQSSAVSKIDGPMYRITPPSMSDMWYAQLEVWVQRNVIDSIARINNTAAEPLNAQKPDNHAWVGNLPIKDILSFQMTYYVGTEDVSVSSVSNRATPPVTTEEVWTDTGKTNPLYDTLHFTIKLIVDARSMPTVISGLCENNFHTPLNVQYKAVAPNTEMTGKIYGDAPVVELTIDFETVMFFEFYGNLMPDEILKTLNRKRPEKKENNS